MKRDALRDFVAEPAVGFIVRAVAWFVGWSVAALSTGFHSAADAAICIASSLACLATAHAIVMREIRR